MSTTSWPDKNKRPPMAPYNGFGKRQPSEHKGQWLVEEIEAGDYYRAFLISQDVAADKISAELKCGVLTIHLPRVEAAQPRKISVKGQ